MFSVTMTSTFRNHLCNSADVICGRFATLATVSGFRPCWHSRQVPQPYGSCTTTYRIETVQTAPHRATNDGNSDARNCPFLSPLTTIAAEQRKLLGQRQRQEERPRRTQPRIPRVEPLAQRVRSIARSAAVDRDCRNAEADRVIRIRGAFHE
jgi:hypothetical protein